MEKTKNTEKIILIALGLIILTILILLWLRVDIFQSTPEGITVTEDSIARRHNLLAEAGVVLTVSSQNSPDQSAEKLTDRNPRSFWHISLAQVGTPAWVKVDFGKGKDRTVRAVAARPREDVTKQFFRNAELQGSMDGVSWKPIVALIQGVTPPTNDWRIWTFSNNQPFRYYQILISSGHEDSPQQNFYSLAELALFE